MMDDVAEAVLEPVTTGAKVWIAYNHGFIVKTPDVVFAFDLVDGRNVVSAPGSFYFGWNDGSLLADNHGVIDWSDGTADGVHGGGPLLG